MNHIQITSKSHIDRMWIHTSFGADKLLTKFFAQKLHYLTSVHSAHFLQISQSAHYLTSVQHGADS